MFSSKGFPALLLNTYLFKTRCALLGSTCIAQKLTINSSNIVLYKTLLVYVTPQRKNVIYIALASLFLHSLVRWVSHDSTSKIIYDKTMRSYLIQSLHL